MNLPNLYQPPLNSHKGQNGKLLVVGGSRLFHSSIFWSADIASRVVDIVHFTSPANENNEIIRKKIKENFWTGIVVDWGNVEEYISEDDCVLIGPGMVRQQTFRCHSRKSSPREAGGNLYKYLNRFRLIGRNDIELAAKNDDTVFIVNYLLAKYPNKRWVIDGGALQMVDPKLLNQNMIITPHQGEYERLYAANLKRSNLANLPGNFKGRTLSDCTILLKGPIDIINQGKKSIEIPGGNAGLTKGGTGDVLAGLVAALYCKNDAWTAAITGSYVTKKAGEELYQKVGYYFNAQDLLNKIPEVLKEFNVPT